MRHIDKIQMLIDELTYSHMIANAILESYANDKDFDSAVIFQLIRDTLVEQKTALKSLIEIHKEE